MSKQTTLNINPTPVINASSSTDNSTFIYKKIIVFGGLLMSIYFLANIQSFTLVPHSNNILSHSICGLIHTLPWFIIKLFFILLIFNMIYSLYTTKYLQMLSIISFILFDIGVVVAINSFCLENLSSFLLFKVNYEIPLYLKEYFFIIEYKQYMSHFYPKLCAYPEWFDLFQTYLKEAIKNNPPVLTNMNGIMISEYLHDIFNNSWYNLKNIDIPTASKEFLGPHKAGLSFFIGFGIVFVLNVMSK